MNARTLLLWALLPAILTCYASQPLAQPVCSAPQVKLGNNFILIAPTGSNDTANLQCALDWAVARNIPEIRLSRGDFYIGALSAERFLGTLQGSGRDHTRLNLLNHSIDCGHAFAAIRFAGGEPRIRWLSVIWDLQPCREGGGWLESLIQFTGAIDEVAGCASEVIHAVVDRVTLHGSGFEFSNGIVASPTSGGPDCGNRLLGTLRVNRSTIVGFGTGILVRMEGGAQVGIYGNYLERNHTGLSLWETMATVVVKGNRFASFPYETPSSCHRNAVGLGILSGVMAREPVRLDVYGNRFEVDQSGWCSGFGIWMNRQPHAAPVSVSIAQNDFLLSGFSTAVHSVGVSGTVVNNNTFSANMPSEAMALFVSAEDIDEAEKWTIISNRGFEELENLVDIYLDTNVSQTVIGPGQRASVIDLGRDNTVLPQ